MYDYTIDELISVCISRQVIPGDVWGQGINTPLVMAGLILAKCTHAPDLRFASAIGPAICQDWSPLSVGRTEDMWMGHGLLHMSFATVAAELLPAYKPKEFLRPAQINAAGSFNNIAFGKSYSQPRMRLPGTGGIPDVTVSTDHFFLYVPRHSRLTFSPKLDFVSGMGHVPHRKRGGGPTYLISDLGQFDWHEGQMRLTTLHHDVTLDQVRSKTGFEVLVAPDLHETRPPTPEELRLLREDIDPMGVRRLEMLGGTARKQLLRDILQREGAL